MDITDFDVNETEFDETEPDLESAQIQVEELIAGTDGFDDVIDVSDASSGGGIDLYKQYATDMRNIGSDKFLSREEEYDLAIKAISGDSDAANKLVEKNMLLVCSIAKRYTGFGVDFLDLVQEGNLGLIVAINKFDPSKGFRFSTYAYWWVRQHITRSLSEKGMMVRYPVHVTNGVFKIKKIVESFVNANGREPTDVELAELTGFTVSKVSYLLGFDFSHVSLDAPVSDDGNVLFGDFIAGNNDNPANIVIDNAMADAVVSAVKSQLNDDEQYVIFSRFGFLGDKKTLKELAAEFGVSRERIRQIEGKSLKKLYAYLSSIGIDGS